MMGIEIIVATDGSGDFSDIQAALNAAEPGDTVYIRDGDYSVPDGLVLDTPNVTVAGYPGDEMPRIFAPNTSDGPHAVFSFDIDSDGSTLRGLDISGGREYVVKLETAFEYDDRSFGHTGQAASNITIENNKLHDSGRDVIKITPNCDNVKILYNEIYDSGRQGTTDDHPAANAEGIDAVNSDNLLVKGNHIHHIATTGAYAKGGSKGTVFEDNLIEYTGISTANVPNSGAGLSLGYETDANYHDADNTDYIGSFDGTISNNIIRHTLDAGIQLIGAENPVVENNTIIDAGGVESGSTRWYLGGIATYPLVTYTGPTDTVEAHTSNPTIVNNLVETAAVEEWQEAWALNDPLSLFEGTVLDAAEIDGNVYWDGNGETLFSGGSFEAYQVATGFDTDGMVLDFSEMLDDNSIPLPGTPLEGGSAGASVAAQYGYSPDYQPEMAVDETPPQQVVITHAEDYETQYHSGKLVYWDSPEDAVYFKVYLNGDYVGYTTASGYYTNQEGTYEIAVEAVDNAGNVSALSEGFTFTYGDPDAESPQGEPAPDEPEQEEPSGDDPAEVPLPENAVFTEIDGVGGVVGISIVPGTDNGAVQIRLHFEGESYFGYTAGALVISDASSGESVMIVNPETGTDPQEGQSFYDVFLDGLSADGSYTLNLENQFARLELPSGSWSVTGATEAGGLTFDVMTGEILPAGDAPQPETPQPDTPDKDVPQDNPDDEDVPEMGDYMPIENVTGIQGISISQSDGDDGGMVTVYFEGKSYFGYTSGTLDISNAETGEIVASVNPEPGDSQEGSETFTVPLPAGLPEGDYIVTADYKFARVVLENGTWVTTGEIVEDQAITFSVGDETPFIAIDDVPGIVGAEVQVPTDGTEGSLTLHFEGETYFGYTRGTLDIRDMSSGELVMSVNPDLGDTQQGATTFEVILPADMASGNYVVTVGYQFARLELDDGSWMTTAALDEDVLSFLIADEKEMTLGLDAKMMSDTYLDHPDNLAVLHVHTAASDWEM